MVRKLLALLVLSSLLLVSLFGVVQAQTETEAEGQEYIVQADDWLSKIADKFYGDILAYPTIVEATNAKAATDDSFAVIENPDVIEIGQKLWIPNVPGTAMMPAGEMAGEETVMEATGAETTTMEATMAETTTMEAETMEATAPETTTMETETMEATTTETTTMAAETTEGEMMAAEEVMTTTTYALPGDAVFPEGVAYNAASGKFYVDSTTDGTLFEGDLASGEVTVFSAGGADGRTTAIGLKVDSDGKLWVSGGGTGQMFVYDTADGSLVASYTTPAAEQTFINDVTITPDGSAYFTDSFRPILFKISNTEGGEAESWLDFSGTVLEYSEGYNLNGIAASADGQYLLTVHSGTGNLYRIDTASKEVIQVDTGGADLTAGDGILLIGDTLYVTRNSFGEIVPVTMNEDLSAGTAGEPITDPSFIYPTTIAQADGSLLVVNSQFNNRGGSPVLPFSVSQIPLP